MALSFAFGETLSSPAKRPTLVPGQFVQRGGVLLLQLFERGGRFVQHAVQFRDLLLRLHDSSLKLSGLLEGSQQELVAFGQIVR